MDMIIFVVAPAWASRRPVAFRNPCGLQSIGSPALEIASRCHWLNPSTVKDLPYAVVSMETCSHLNAARAQAHHDAKGSLTRRAYFSESAERRSELLRTSADRLSCRL